MASAFLLDECSQLRRSHNQEGLLSNDALRASFDNRRKNHCERPQVCDEVAIIGGIRYSLCGVSHPTITHKIKVTIFLLERIADEHCILNGKFE